MFEVPLEALHLSVRARNVLHGMNIKSIGQLIETPIEQIEVQRNMGIKTLTEIKEKLTQLSNDPTSFLMQLGANQEEVMPHLPADILIELSNYEIDKLGLSVRSVNALIKAGYTTIDKVVTLNKERLAQLHAVGAKSKKEIIERTKEWLEEIGFMASNSGEENEEATEADVIYQDIAERISSVFNVYWRILKHICFKSGLHDKLMSSNLTLSYDEKIKIILSIPEFKRELKKAFVALTPDNTGAMEIDVFEKKMAEFKITFDRQILKDSLLTGVCICQGEYIYISREKLQEQIEKIQVQAESNRQMAILLDRLKGRCLQEIGDEIGLTRERVRQISIKAMNQLPLLMEDYYKEPFEYFYFTKSIFCEVFPECEGETYEYLNLKYKHGDIALNSDNVNVYAGIYQSRLLKYISEVEIKRDKKSVSREKMVFRVLMNCGDKSLTIEEFEERYYRYIEEREYPVERLKLNMRSLANHLRKAKHIVFNRTGLFRYCEAEPTEIWNNVDFSQFKNLIVSAELIYRKYEELMNDLDIRDGYELFCIIKTSIENWNEKEFEINCRRIPIIVFGEASEETQTIQLLKEVSPVDYFAFYEAYEERFGVRKETAQANLGSFISRYYFDGKYSIDVPVLDERDKVAFRAALEKKEFWYIDEIEKIFEETCHYSSKDALNSAAFTCLGYSLNAGYACKLCYPSIRDYLKKGVFSVGIIDTSKFDSRLLQLSAFWSFLASEKKTFNYVEVSPKVIISREILFQQYRITREDIEQFLVEVKPFCDEKYFNAYSIWGDIQKLEFVRKVNGNHWLCTNIIRQAEEVVSLGIANAVILTEDKAGLSLSQICEWVVRHEGKQSLSKLTNRINELFGSTLQKHKIANKIRCAGLWRNLVTDDMDWYIETLLNGSEVNNDDLFAEEFF